MRAIKLCVGSGNGRSSACLATAVSMMNGESPSDRPKCMCPVIAAFVRATNDAMPQEFRDELYSPLIMELIGTRSTLEIEKRRCAMVVGYVKHLRDTEKYPPSKEHYKPFVHDRALKVSFRRMQETHLEPEHRASHASSIIYYIYMLSDSRQLWVECRDLIRKMIALDPPAPVEPAMSLDTLAGMLR